MNHHMSVARTLDVTSSLLVSVVRLGTGTIASPAARQPEKLLELYEFEACPFCRKAREALSVFDLDAIIYPCPRGGERFRPQVKARGGKRMYPYLVDPNTGLTMYESNDVVRYLAHEYGAKVPFTLALGPLTTLSSIAASGARPMHGRAARPSKLPEKMLELWSFESSPYCRIVREVLCELELPYVLHNVAKGSKKRAAFVERSGRMMVPYLADPNTGREMFESADIVRYLEETYAV